MQPLLYRDSGCLDRVPIIQVEHHAADLGLMTGLRRNDFYGHGKADAKGSLGGLFYVAAAAGGALTLAAARMLGAFPA